MLNRATEFLDFIIEERLSGKGELNVIDATAGNGNDCLKILSAMNGEGFLTGFDIQGTAIENTDLLLKNNGFSNYSLINDGHENIDIYFEAESVDFIIYNLGYLPRGDKSVHTCTETTLASIFKALNALKKNGLAAVVTYPGYGPGKDEHMEVFRFFEELNQKEFNVFHGSFINQKNNPPNLFLVEKR